MQCSQFRCVAHHAFCTSTTRFDNSIYRTLVLTPISYRGYKLIIMAISCKGQKLTIKAIPCSVCLSYNNRYLEQSKIHVQYSDKVFLSVQCYWPFVEYSNEKFVGKA